MVPLLSSRPPMPFVSSVTRAWVWAAQSAADRPAKPEPIIATWGLRVRVGLGVAGFIWRLLPGWGWSWGQ